MTDVSARPARAGLRLEYLDGLRALASIYVVLFHAGAGFSSNQLPFVARSVRHLLTFGHHAVAIFIVLSGYCLMLPVVRGNGHLFGGVRRYLFRRARRILPPYYAALGLSLALIALIPALATPTGTIWDDTSPALAWGPIATHLLLIHNLFPNLIYRINGPLWSVATEWQIYFFFPLVLLPIWERAGTWLALLAAFALGLLPLLVAPAIADRWIPWYLGLFALGMCAAAIGFSERPVERRLREAVPWKIVLLALAACCAIGVTVLVRQWFGFMPASDALVGATTAALLVHYSDSAVKLEGAQRPLCLRFLESRPLVRLGHFSYSLYLTHLPVVALCYFALRRFELSPQLAMFALVVISVPASLFVAYAFFLVFERRFVNQPQRAPGVPVVTR